MPSVLRIFFNGMCGFVPEKNEKEMTVLLPNLKTEPGPFPRHQPALIFLHSQVTDSSGRCDELPEEYGLNHDRLCAWNLDFEHLEIRRCDAAGNACKKLRDENLKVERGKRPHGAKVPRKPNEMEDFSWVTPMDDLLLDNRPNAGKLLAEVMAPKTDTTRIVGRLKIPEGDVRCFETAREPINSDQMYTYKFATAENEHDLEPQALAELASIDIVFPETIQITARKLNAAPGQIDDHVTFSDTSAVVHVALVNVPPFSNVSPDEPRPTGHFAKFYELLQSPPERPFRFVPVRDQVGNRDMAAVSLPDIFRIATKAVTVDSKIEITSIRNEKLCPFVQFAEYP
jgi:hypothetical protein